MMKVLQRGEFKKAYKRLNDNQLDAVNEAIEKVVENPAIGEQKKGDLVRFRVYKFPVLDQIYLLAYVHDEEEGTLTLRAFGPHANFYQLLAGNGVKDLFEFIPRKNPGYSPRSFSWDKLCPPDAQMVSA